MTNKKKLAQKSRELSYLLRHDPKGLSMCKNGYVLVSDLLLKMDITLTELVSIVQDDDKKRYSFKNEDNQFIRANQGHSFKVDLGLKKVIPPFILYHGTKKDHINSIMKTGLTSMRRNHVHLSGDIETANIVANRRKGENIILKIQARAMYNDKVDIYLSENGVYLTEFIDPKYIELD